jgi:hypothetical protein
MLEGVEYELRQAIGSPKSNRMRDLIDDHYGCCDCANEYERQSRVSRDFPLSVVHDFPYCSSQRGLPAWPRARREADSKAGATDVPSPGAKRGAGRCKSTRATKQCCDRGRVVDVRHRGDVGRHGGLADNGAAHPNPKRDRRRPVPVPQRRGRVARQLAANPETAPQRLRSPWSRPVQEPGVSGKALEPK